MLGFKFVKFEPNFHVFKIKNGKVVKEGKGISFWFYTPSTSIVQIPIESKSAPFIFDELTEDFQTVTVQGEIIFRIGEPEKIKEQVNFSIDNKTLTYNSDDPAKINQRIINVVKTVVKKEIARLSLREAIRAAETIASSIMSLVSEHEYLTSLGIQVTAINILAILPSKETARALEAETRENILKEADDATYNRRNAAVEQERKIRENELNTEIAVEQKQRQIRETQMEAERSIKEKERQLAAEEMSFKINQEEENKKLVALAVENKNAEAEARAYAIKSVLEAFKASRPEVISALAAAGMRPEQLIANAFAGIANNADKIGELNISPELLQSIIKKR